MSVEIRTVYRGSLRCESTHGPSGQTLSTEAPVDNGGTGAAFSPTDLVATGLGSCILTILGLVASRHDIDIEGTKVQTLKEMVATPVRRIGKLTVIVTFPPDKPFDPKHRPRFENAAEMCPVKQSLHPDVLIDMRFEYPT
jgi:putative redox protein